MIYFSNWINFFFLAQIFLFPVFPFGYFCLPCDSSCDLCPKRFMTGSHSLLAPLLSSFSRLVGQKQLAKLFRTPQQEEARHKRRRKRRNKKKRRTGTQQEASVASGRKKRSQEKRRKKRPQAVVWGALCLLLTIHFELSIGNLL